MKERIKQLISLPEWNQQRLSIKLKVSINTVKSWTRKRGNKTPCKLIAIELEKIFEAVGI